MSNIIVDTVESKELVLNQISAFKEDLKFIDVVLIAGRDNKKVPAHRLLLASRSAYFRAMFTSSLPENKRLEVPIKDVTGENLNNIIKYCYSGIIELGDDNVETIWATASVFKLTDLINACCDFLAKRINAANCLKYWTVAEKFCCPRLLAEAKSIAYDNFMDIRKSNEFLTLDNGQLRQMLASDEISVTSEDEVFLSLIRWFQHNERERQQYISDLLLLVRVPFLSATFVVEQRDFIFESIGFQAFSKEIFNWHVIPTEKRPAINTRPRNWICETFAVNTGYLSGNIPILKYCQKDDVWTTWTTLQPEQKRQFFGVATMDNELVTAGGQLVSEFEAVNTVLSKLLNPMKICLNGVTVVALEVTAGGRLVGDASKPVNTVLSINTKTKQYKLLNPMKTCRSSVSLVALDANIYAIGGVGCDDTWLNSVERWNQRTGNWSDVAPMIAAKTGQNAAVLNGQIYVIGKSTSVECYDPHTNAWTARAAMHEQRRFPGVAVLNGYLYAIGGWNSKTVERYDSNTNTWTMMCSMSSPRLRFGCIAIKDRIIAAGGCNHSTVEEYNPITNTWMQKSSLSISGKCVVVKARI